jgi:cyanate permease
MMIGLFSTIPAVIAVVAKIIVGRSSDSKKEFRWHFTVPALAGAAGFLLMWVFPHSPWWGIFCLTLAYGGAHATMPIIFAAPGMYWSGTSAAAAIAIINSMGTVAGAIGPAMVGFIKTATGSFAYSNMIQSSLLIIGSVMILTLVSRKDELRTSPDDSSLEAGMAKNAPATENVAP